MFRFFFFRSVLGAVFLFGMGACASEGYRQADCSSLAVTKTFLAAYDSAELGRRSTERSFEIYTGVARQSTPDDGVLNMSWLWEMYSPLEVRRWANRSDKVAALVLADTEELPIRKIGLLTRAAQVETRSCLYPLRELRRDGQLDASCYNEFGDYSPFTQGLAEAHYALSVCYRSPNCRLDSEKARYHSLKAKALGAPQLLGQ